MKCRHCGAELRLTLVDLGSAPPSNAYLTERTLRAPETWYPLRVRVCERCWLAQTEDFAKPSDFFDAGYAYFSGYSSTWLAHCERYAGDMVGRFGLDGRSHVVEIAANDGSLLLYFKKLGIPCTGVDPTSSTAAAAREKGLLIVEDFFGTGLAKKLAEEGKQADLAVANNVLAHVPDINDFVAAFGQLLRPHGVVTFEFPHLLNLIAENQFDTIYHEHFSYLSLTAVMRIFAANGLSVFDVEELPIHGGSLRVYAERMETGHREREPRVRQALNKEAEAGLLRTDFYQGFQARADKVKNDFLGFLLEAKARGKTVVAYGAAAKGNTLLNYAGIRPDLIPFVVDRNPAKQGKYLPGSRIRIVAEQRLKDVRADFVLILPWNLRTEVMQQLGYIRDWGGCFVVAVPELEIL